MSPILVRPVREQFEHDRVIRVLQARYKRKYEVAINPGAEQNSAVTVGELTMYPDLVLFSPERGRKMLGTIEVETGESINTLEAMAEWGPFSRLRTPFFLYVPAHTIDSVRRLCSDHSIAPAEIWTYHAAMDQFRFTMVHRSPEAAKADARATRATEARAAAQASVAAQPPAAEPPPAPVKGANGSPARALEAQTKSAKPQKAAKKAAPRLAKTAKKASPKKAPRAAASRPRAAKKAARKSTAKRSASPKR